MSRRHPIFIYASDEEPTEGPTHASSSSGSSSSSIHPIALSDDTSAAYLFPPPTAPVIPPTATPTDPAARFLGSTFMAARHMGAGPSTGPTPRMTARMSVRDIPRGPLAPRDKAPVEDEREIPCDEQSQRIVPRPAHLEWMTPILARWRSVEGLPSTFETGESSRSPAPLHTTGEPVELTLPTLIAVIRTLFRITAGRSSQLLELQSDVSRLEGDVSYVHERCHFLLGNVVVAREIAEAARDRVRVLERRARIAGLAIGACVLSAAVMAAVRTFLPWFY